MRLTFTLSILVSTVFSASIQHLKLKRVAGNRKANAYIVKLKDGASRENSIAALNSLSGQLGSGCEIGHDQWTVINGYSAHLSDACLLDVLNDPNVDYVEEDGIFTINYAVPPRNPSSAPNHVSRDTSLSGCGTGTNFYGVDTGIRITHSAFTGRALWGATFGGYPDEDDNGHGTHTAGTAAGVGYGPATCSQIYAVKVISGSGQGVSSDIISGIDWAVAHAVNSGRPSVVNLSLGGPVSESLDAAILRGIEKGIHFTVAAGNSDAPAKNSSPARVQGAVTVGAVDSKSDKACFSNYGPELAVWDLGVNVLSAWSTTDTATETLSGTSMAAPGVNGKLLVALSKYGSMNPTDLIKQLKGHAVHQVKFHMHLISVAEFNRPSGSGVVMTSRWTTQLSSSSGSGNLKCVLVIVIGAPSLC